MPPDGTSFRRSVLQGFLWLGTGTFIGQFISWLSTIFVIRLLEPSDYGLMAMASGFISLLTMVSEMGISAALIQAKELNEHTIRQVFGLVIITGLVALGSCYAGAPLVGEFYQEKEAVVLLQILAFSIIPFMLIIIPQSLCMREMNFGVKAKIDIIAQVGSVAITLMLAISGYGVWSLVAGQMAAPMVKAFGFYLQQTYWVTPLFSIRGTRDLLKYGLTVTGDRLLNFIYQESDKIIVGKVLGDAILGVYAVSLNLASIPMEKVLPIVTQVSFTTYARMQNDLERIRKNVLLSIRFSSLVGFPIFYGMSAVASLAIPLVLGSKWDLLVDPFRLICLVLPLKMISSITSPAVFAIGKPMVNLVNMKITAVIMVCAFLLGAQGGLLGVSYAWLLVYPLVFSVTITRSLKCLGIPLSAFVKEILSPFIASLGMVALSEVIKLSILIQSPLYALSLHVVTGAFLYLGIMLLLKRPVYSEVKMLIGRRDCGCETRS